MGLVRYGRKKKKSFRRSLNVRKNVFQAVRVVWEPNSSVLSGDSTIVAGCCHRRRCHRSASMVVGWTALRFPAKHEGKLKKKITVQMGTQCYECVWEREKRSRKINKENYSEIEGQWTVCIGVQVGQSNWKLRQKSEAGEEGVVVGAIVKIQMVWGWWWWCLSRQISEIVVNVWKCQSFEKIVWVFFISEM